MPFLAVSASLLGLLLAASLVSAECAWVLWETKEDVQWDARDKAHSDSTWKILRSYASLKDCKDDQAKLLSGDTSWALPYPGTKPAPEGDGFYATLRSGGRIVRTIHQRALCVPGTIDPREPKVRWAGSAARDGSRGRG